MDSGMPLDGAILADRYKVQRRLARGGMGEVWLGHDPVLERDVAVKVMLAVAGAESVRRFQREAATLAGLRHPGISVVHDAGRHEAYFFIVMELLQGRDLARLMAEPEHRGGLPIGRVLDLSRQILDPLTAAHDHGVVHRDLKPSNVFLQTDNRVKVCDFGIARTADASGTLTTTGVIVGTPPYMSPEQCKGHQVDARSDLYAFGVVMFELLTGRLPFPADQPPYLLMHQHMEQDPPRPSTLRTGIPGDLEDLVMGLLAKDPGDRPDARALATTLAALDDGDSVPTTPLDPVGAARFTRRGSGPAPAAPTVAATRVDPGPSRPAYTLRRTVAAETLSVSAVAFSPNGRTLATGETGGAVCLWDPLDGRQFRRLAGHEKWVNAVVFSSDGHTVATCSDDKVIRLWDPQTGTLLRQLTGHTYWVYAIAFSPDGHTLASAGADNSVRVWNGSTGEERFAFAGLPRMRTVAFSPDGHILAAAGEDGLIRAWNAHSGKRHRRLTVRGASRTYTVAFSPDGHTLVAGGEDGVVRVWDAHTGKRRRQLTGHTAAIISLAFSPDGRALAVGDKSGAVILRDTHTYEQLLVLSGQSGHEWRRGVAFSPDGGTLASVALDGVQLWETGT